MAYGRGEYAKCFEVAPVGAAVWLFLFLICVVFILLNMFIAILVEHYGAVKASLGDQGLTIGQHMVLLYHDFIWSSAYQLRQLWRLLLDRVLIRLGDGVVAKLPRPADEPTRVSPILYDEMLDVIDLVLVQAGDKPDESLPPLKGGIQKNMFLKAGIDSSTADHLSKNYLAYAKRNKYTSYPMDKVCFEFDKKMQQFDADLDNFRDDLKVWFEERLIDTNSLDPRLQKLDTIARSIEPAVLPPPPPPPPPPPGEPDED